MTLHVVHVCAANQFSCVDPRWDQFMMSVPTDERFAMDPVSDPDSDDLGGPAGIFVVPT